MEIRKFSLDDMDFLLSWLEQRKCYLPNRDEMPEIGYMAWEGDTPIACAFLRRVEGNHGQLDGLATSPWLPGEMRHFAIDAVVQQILSDAKALGMRSLHATSVDESTLMRSKRHGFVPMPHTLIVADLTRRST
jgi:N-acetylglutamate synthase-like GNAT family acetyltransferase